MSLPEPVTDDIHATLQGVFGYTGFRPAQQEIIEGLMAGEDAFVLMPREKKLKMVLHGSQ